MGDDRDMVDVKGRTRGDWDAELPLPCPLTVTSLSRTEIRSIGEDADRMNTLCAARRLFSLEWRLWEVLQESLDSFRDFLSPYGNDEMQRHVDSSGYPSG